VKEFLLKQTGKRCSCIDGSTKLIESAPEKSINIVRTNFGILKSGIKGYDWSSFLFSVVGTLGKKAQAKRNKMNCRLPVT